MLTQNSLIGVRDPYGIRPLVIGKLGNSYVLASETCALDIIGAKFLREVENGEIVLIENNKLISIKPFPPKKVRPCVFEYIYFSRPDSLLDNITAYEHRKNLGKELAKENNINADIVVPVPDSGNAAALGFSQELKINFEHGLIRNHYVGRTFIEPSQKIRSLGVKLKLNANETTIKNKKIILIDDSLVRGTTSHKIVKMLYDAGAKEVHVMIACPEIKFPDFYGVDTPTKKELLAANKSNDEICEYIGAKSLKFLSSLTDTLEGYQISRLEHSLQSATRAYKANENEEMVVAALLHDIGDELAPMNHSEYAASILKPYVSERTHWIIEKHGEFQMFYYAHHLGGDKNRRDKYKDHKYYKDTINFCENYDQNSFDPNYKSFPLDFFKPMVIKIFSRKPYSAI